jgi:hypothetical protein
MRLNVWQEAPDSSMFLKPTKDKVLGTILLLIADWLAGFISGQLAIPKSLTEGLGPAFIEAFGTVNIFDLIFIGLIVSVIGFLLKLVFFYVVVSYLLEKKLQKQEK